MPKPNAKPEYSSGSMPTAANTFGSTMPHPPSSIHPDPEQVRQFAGAFGAPSGAPTPGSSGAWGPDPTPSRPLPPQIGHVTSNSADGSVNGKNEGRNLECIPAPKNAVVKASIVPARSPKVMPRSTTRPSI